MLYENSAITLKNVCGALSNALVNIPQFLYLESGSTTLNFLRLVSKRTGADLVFLVAVSILLQLEFTYLVREVYFEFEIYLQRFEIDFLDSLPCILS